MLAEQKAPPKNAAKYPLVLLVSVVLFLQLENIRKINPYETHTDQSFGHGFFFDSGIQLGWRGIGAGGLHAAALRI